jgi:prepilin-type processing-associated H-X9-DG protein
MSWPGLLVALAATAVLALAAILIWPPSASAHGGVGVTVSGDGRGGVRVNAAWADGHPVTGVVGASFTAVSDTGVRVGPVALKMTGEGALRYDGTLPTGQWSVVVDIGLPAIARCAATLAVGSGTPTAVTCPASAPPSSPASGPGPAGDSAGSGRRPWLLGGLVVVVVLLGLLAAARVGLVAQRRAPRDTVRPR